MNKRSCFVLVVMSVVLWSAGALAEAAERSPFDSAPGAKGGGRYDYSAALGSVNLCGVIYTESMGMAVFQDSVTKTASDGAAKNNTSYLILKKGEKFIREMAGLSHTFRVFGFKGKKVILVAGNKEVFEVTP